MIASIVVSIARLATKMPQYANQAQHYLTAATNLLAKYGVGPEQLQSLADQQNWGKIAQFVGSLLDGIPASPPVRCQKSAWVADQQ